MVAVGVITVAAASRCSRAAMRSKGSVEQCGGVGDSRCLGGAGRGHRASSERAAGEVMDKIINDMRP